MLRVLVFGFDGNLVNSMFDLTCIAAAQINKFYGLSLEMSKHLYLLTSGLPFEDQLALMFPGKEQNAFVVESFEQAKAKILFEEALFPEVKEVFTELADLGYKLVISSSNFQHLVEQYVTKFELKIDLVLGYQDGFGKGEPHFNYIKNYFKVEKDALVFISDSIKDLECAKNNGIEFIGKSGTFKPEGLRVAGVKHIIESFRELPTVLSSINTKVESV